jgi:hypothetical protein
MAEYDRWPGAPVLVIKNGAVIGDEAILRQFSSI